MLRTIAGDVRDRRVDVLHHAHRDDGIQVFGIPVLLGRGRHARIDRRTRRIAAHRAAGVEQGTDQRRKMGGHAAPVHQQRFRRAAHAGAPQLGVQHDVLRHLQVRLPVHIHVADALEMSDHRHARLLLHALDQIPAAARHDHVDVVRHLGEHVAHRRAIDGRHPLDAPGRQAGDAQALLQTGVDGRIGIRALRTAAQDHAVARLQAQTAGIGRDVRPALVDDADHAERHPHALYAHAIGTRPLGEHRTDGVRQIDDLVEAPRHPFHATVVELEPVEQRRRQRAGGGLTHVTFVRGQYLVTVRAQRRRGAAQGAVLGVGGGERKHPGRGPGGPAEAAHELRHAHPIVQPLLTHACLPEFNNTRSSR